MPQTDFLPRRDADLAAWSKQFATLVTAGMGDNYGLTSAETSAFGVENSIWLDALKAASGNNTRTPAAISIKNNARKSMIVMARKLAAIVRANSAVTDAERIALGLNVPAEAAPVGVPASPPLISIELATGVSVKIRFRNSDQPDSRGKPEGVFGAAVLTSLGPAAPLLSDISEWTWQGNMSRALNTLEFPGAASGTTAWITAMWFNRRGENGPPAQPISVQIPGQLPAAA